MKQKDDEKKRKGIRERKPNYKEYRASVEEIKDTGGLSPCALNVEFLSDPTGNRRWLPFEVEYIMSPRDNPFDYAAVYAQAYALYRQGFRYWFSQSEIQRLAEYNEQFEVPKIEHELVDIFFRKPIGAEQGVFMPVARALQLIGSNSSLKISDRKLGRAFSDLGYEFKRTSTSRGYIVVQRSGSEIQERLEQLASDDVTW